MQKLSETQLMQSSKPIFLSVLASPIAGRDTDSLLRHYLLKYVCRCLGTSHREYEKFMSLSVHFHTQSRMNVLPPGAACPSLSTGSCCNTSSLMASVVITYLVGRQGSVTRAQHARRAESTENLQTPFCMCVVCRDQ